jgi:hypothetical protein
MIVIVLGAVASVITIVTGAGWLSGIVKRSLAERSAHKQPPAVVPQRRPARISSAASAARMSIRRSTTTVSRFGDDPWACTYATPGSYAERVRARARTRGITPSEYIQSKR